MMQNPHKTYFNWSTGKDSALALYHLWQDPLFNIDQLITTTSQYDRVSMHGLRTSLMYQQVAAMGIPLMEIRLPEQPTMETYNDIMSQYLQKLLAKGYTHCGFGDIFLEDLKTYREAQLNAIGISAIFPLWKQDTTELAKEFINLGFRSIVVCINSDLLDESFVGREMDASFLSDLPTNIDPCGENGEFHTFCFDGPLFSEPITFEKGKKVFRTYKAPKKNNVCSSKATSGFWFIDLLPTTDWFESK